jgi:hypothetical protein
MWPAQTATPETFSVDRAIRNAETFSNHSSADEFGVGANFS